MPSSIAIRRGESLPQLYQRLVTRAREFDPRVVGGACSPNELTRMEKLVEQLEKQADEKARLERGNDPLNIASGELRGLWKRAHEARCEILELQEGKAKAYRRQLAVVGVPAKLFATVPFNEIPETPPYNWTLENYEACIAESTPTVVAFEEWAAALRRHIADWERLSPDQQLWKALFALAFEPGRWEMA